MRPIQIFFMNPPGRDDDDRQDEKRKHSLLSDMLKRALEISGKIDKLSGNIKDLPHTEHSGGG